MDPKIRKGVLTISATLSVIVLILGLLISSSMASSAIKTHPTKDEVATQITAATKDFITTGAVQAVITNGTSSLTKDVAQASADAKSAANAASAASTDAKNALSTANQANSQLATIQTTANGANSKASQVSDLVTQLQGTVKTLGDQLSAATTQLATSNATIDALKTDVAALKAAQATGTGGTTTGGVTTGSNLVTATVMGNSWTGSPSLSFGTIAPGATVQQSFNFTLGNSTPTAVTNIQLAMGLQLVDMNLAILTNGLPTCTFQASSGITNGSLSTPIIWSAQATGIPYLVGFINNVATGFVTSFGVLTQPVGNTVYTVNVSVTNTGTAATPAFQIYPMMKVMSFTKVQ